MEKELAPHEKAEILLGQLPPIAGDERDESSVRQVNEELDKLDQKQRPDVETAVIPVSPEEAAARLGEIPQVAGEIALAGARVQA